MPKSQLANLYASKNNKDNVTKIQDKKSENNTAKKVPKRVEKVQEQPKPKPPKSIESALNSVLKKVAMWRLFF